MFDGAVHRDENDYFKWEGREHQTMCYPGLKLFRYPKKVKVNKKKDKDMCDKHFHSNSDFTAGIFSVGCSCEYNKTLGIYLFTGTVPQSLMVSLFYFSQIFLHFLFV